VPEKRPGDVLYIRISASNPAGEPRAKSKNGLQTTTLPLLLWELRQFDKGIGFGVLEG